MENKWISVKDKLPETEGYAVLVSDQTTAQSVGFTYKDEFYMYDGNKKYSDVGRIITHWMELPDSPI